MSCYGAYSYFVDLYNCFLFIHDFINILLLGFYCDKLYNLSYAFAAVQNRQQLSQKIHVTPSHNTLHTVKAKEGTAK